MIASDTQMLDWMQHEGLESVIRLDKRGWLNMWTGTMLYRTMREAIVAGMVASAQEYELERRGDRRKATT